MRRTTLIATAVIALLAVGSASAAIAVYKNNFSSRSEFKDLRKLTGGKQCGKSWKGKKALGVVVKRGNRDCALRTPVVGDANQPDHKVAATGKVAKKNQRKVLKSLYVGLAVRANRKGGYELRVFPKGRRWQLIRNGARVEAGRDKAIGALGKANKMQLRAFGRDVVAKVNRKRLVKFRDQDPEQVAGRKVAVTYGNKKRSKKKATSRFDRVIVQVPNP